MSYFNSRNEIYFAKIRPSAVIPTKKLEDAGYDMYADFEEEFLVIFPGQTKPVPTGIAVAFSDKYYAQIEERSSMAKIGIKKSGGVFDSGYRGEYFIMTYNTNKKPFVITKTAIEQFPETFEIDGVSYNREDLMLYPYKKAICQMVLQEVPVMEEKEITYEELLKIPSQRGTGAFGHSGK